MIAIILRIAIIVFGVELAVMFLLAAVNANFNILTEAFLDSSLLTLFISPIVYFWVIKPFVTARNNAEQRLLQFNSELEQKIQEKTKSLQLAKEEAERANNAKSEFLARTSHELRTPLNSILGFSQMMMLDDRDPQDADSIANIYHSGTHLLSIINEILDLAKVESGNIEINMDDIAINEVIEECVEMIKPMASQRGISIEVKTNLDGEYYVAADKNKLSEVILNLASNAVKYNKSNGTVIISTDLTGQHSLRIQVTDTGDGLSENQKQKLFRPMERLGAEYTNIEGTGIGLVISKRLIELMGGTIGFESKEGAGSTFWIEIATSGHSPEQPQLSLNQIRSTDYLKIDPSYKYNVLYIEDNLSNLALMERIFERFNNVNLITTRSPAEGIELASSYKPDLLLLDINLPGMNGYEILKKLKSNSETKSIKAFAVSADAMRNDNNKSDREMFDEYITKPIDVPNFINITMKYLGNINEPGPL